MYPSQPDKPRAARTRAARSLGLGAETIQTEIVNTPAHERFNNLPIGDTLDGYEWFEIMPCRNDESEGCAVQYEAGEVEFWLIYGRDN